MAVSQVACSGNRRGGKSMSAKKSNAQFHHTRWLDNLDHFLENARSFLQEFKQTLFILSGKAWSRFWQETRFLFSRSTAFDYICGGLTALVGLGATLAVLAGFGILGYQGVLWLQEGEWTGLPLRVLFEALFENTALHGWLMHPESWIGLQKLVAWMLENIPLSAALIVPGLIVGFFSAGLMTTALAVRFYQFKKKQKEEEQTS